MKFTANNFVKAAFLVGVASILPVACSKDFLTVAPKGDLTEEVLSTKKGIEGLLIGSYGMLSGRFTWYAGSFNWVHGSILGGDANKGTNSGDQNVLNPLMRFETTATNGAVGDKWGGSFEGVARANAVLRILGKSTDASITADDKKRITGEARFLRGHYYFELKKNFNNVPFFDETLPSAEIVKVPNNTDLWPQIEADFKYGYDNLPETPGALGRANKWAAGAYYAKALLFQKKYAEAYAVFQAVIANGKTAKGDPYGLNDNFADAFNAEFDNSTESVFAIQTAANTGSQGNTNYDFVLNFPYNTGSNGPGNCCGFFQPSFEMANSYRTSSNGLPLLDGSYNDAANALKTDMGLLSSDAFTPDAGNVDPRLDHTVGRRGLPYLDWQDHPGNDWIREQSYAGPFSPKKFIYYKRHEASLTDGSGWTRGYAAMNYNIIRFSDVLLMAAECAVETNNLEEARALVNKVRARAGNASSLLKRADGTNAAQYLIRDYADAWTDQAIARTAVRFERKLELSGEGHRFYDLVRWGVAETELNKYFAYEGAKLPGAVGGAKFTAGKNESYPIPQTQIDRQGADVLKQNPGYN
jgi:starch-binding outer membrane protein, SusD/RagB family